MPQTPFSSSAELGIRLEDSTASSIFSYSPGDVVIGQIYRKASTASPHATLTVSLHGRSVCELRTKGFYTGKLNFFYPSRTSQTLFTDKPLHIQAREEAVWYFSITVPSFVDHSALLSNGFRQKHSYLSLAPADVAAQCLPSSFNFKAAPPGYALTAFIEYYIQAELKVHRGGSTKTHQAILPLRVEQLSPEPPIINFNEKRRSFFQRVSSPRLVPGMESTELSLSQKLQKLVGSSKVPKFAFRVHVEVPTTMQLGNENQIPLRIGIEPLWESTSDNIRGMLQRIKLESFTVRIRFDVRVKFRPEEPFTFPIDIDATSPDLELLSPNSIQALTTDIYIPCSETSTTASTGERVPSQLLDIGELLNFNLGRKNLDRIKTGSGVQLDPCFSTYNIQHSNNELSWELRGGVAGEGFKVSGMHRIKILPASTPFTEPAG
ncbi:hypothetical protein AJ79_06773 [Helicocarpus griseus UAMH5409]|uniref:Arrestin-like N-terminal domain-containing protein n=1 Tax=Helicocarpus griseus UAMH5409 TaxID=1447875 RepID=A0A2B7X947_9EURO|nr:hypothetical protein AJ79_06773 [Helicocarpus griseus UAMH5409]